ncbi:MAG: hypothetical protein Q8K57_11155 [Thiobacillus sp.]|nr:hypothetical protein [Thiobacillus sp.]
MTRSSSLTLVMAAVFTLSYGLAAAEETANDSPPQSVAPPHPENSTRSEKEEKANKKPVENDAAKPAEEPNCE